MSDLPQGLTERELIERLRDRIGRPGEGVVVGIGDDAAVIDEGGPDYLLLTDDAFIDEVHFDLGTWAPRQVGTKAMAATLSDIAAMGGKARTCLVSLMLPRGFETRLLDELYDGLIAAASRYHVSIVGGNVVAGPRLGLCLTATGSVEKAKLCLRSGAEAGHLFAVTGDLGRSEAGRLAASGIVSVDEEAARTARAKHFEPVPRLEEAAALVEAVRVGAMIDISDGLASEVHHIARESNVGARIVAAALPIEEATRTVARAAGVDPVHLALGGGEDFELLLTLSPQVFETALQALAGLGTPVTAIGEVLPREKGVELVGEDGRARPLELAGWDHLTSDR
jgi:thiamine-monophosphate kinase